MGKEAMVLEPVKRRPFKIRGSGVDGAAVVVPEVFLIRNRTKVGAPVFLYMTPDGDLLISKRMYKI